MRGKKPEPKKTTGDSIPPQVHSSSMDEEGEEEDDLSSLSEASSSEDSADSEKEDKDDDQGLVSTREEKKHRGGRKKGQSYRSSYDIETLKAAYAAVVEDGMAVYAASKKFKVPQSTLRDRVLGRISADVTTSGPPTIFTAEEEAGIANYVKLFADIGHPLSRNKVRQMAGELAAQLQRRGFSDGKILSLRWYYKLMDRFPNTQTQKFSNSKLQEIGYGYYKKLSEIIEDYGLEDAPKRVFSLDEICVRTEESSLKMICRNVSDENADIAVVCKDDARITFLGCASASGKKVPPCFVFASNSDNPSRKTVSKIQHGAVVKYSATGECTSQILKEYFESHFSQFVKVGPKSKKHILFYNSRRVCIPLILWLWSESHNVTFFPLPLHRGPSKDPVTLRSTGCLYGVSHSYEMEQKQFEDKNPDIKFTSSDACKILSRIYSGLTVSHFEHMFRLMGVFPLPDRNPGMVRFDKIVEDMKHDGKQKRRRAKKKTIALNTEASPPVKKRRKSKVKVKPRPIISPVTMKKGVKVTDRIRHSVPVDWSGIIAPDEIISVPVVSGGAGDEGVMDDEGSTVLAATAGAHYRLQGIENGVTLEPDVDGGGSPQTYHVYIQGAECVTQGADIDTDNIVVAEEVVIVNTVEDV
ncbi:uncharacterized protein LOC124286324 [Haliotis rubra]|uniref:uncharacterized protein LOC124286324 n=1 Tax=Haliotis rubra TaxID=36100 RepID=UPI001EE57EBC|nr:uncharacterized protein LOC124286324 [Haliotis rubra]